MGIPTFIRFEQSGSWYVTGRYFSPFPSLVSWNYLPRLPHTHDVKARCYDVA